jgi:hypothetical protein
LDAAKFVERDEATRQLQNLGPSVIPALEEALKGDLSAEARTRLKRLLTLFDGEVANPLVPAGELRNVRAVEVLERIGTPAARDALRIAIDGPPSRMAQQSRLALQRLEQRLGDKP